MAKLQRYVVTGPGLDEPPSYADPGPALSRSVTAAERSEVEGTWYVRDSIGDKVLAYSEVVISGGVRSTVVVRH